MNKQIAPVPQYTYIVKVYSKDNNKILNDLSELSSFCFTSKLLSLDFLKSLIEFVIKAKK